MTSSLSLLIHAMLAASPPDCRFRTRRLVFVHIMKCGGLSVDAKLRCHCASATATPCALLREDGSAKHASNSTGDLIARFRDSMLYGDARCAGGPACVDAVASNALVRGPEARSSLCSASILATHASLSAIRARPYWVDAHYIIVLREPVSRVWSFYQYVRRKQHEFQSRPLVYFLKRWRSFVPNGTAAGGFSPHMHWQLSNWMTSQLAAAPKDSLRLAELVERQRVLSLPLAADEEQRGGSPRELALEQAKAALMRMDVVGLTEDMAGFERVLAARWPDTFGEALGRAGRCRIPSGTEARNPTSKHAASPTYGNASRTLDDETRKAISELNALDVSLYAFAMKLARAQAACGAGGGMSTSGAGRRLWARGAAEARRCFERARKVGEM